MYQLMLVKPNTPSRATSGTLRAPQRLKRNVTATRGRKVVLLNVNRT